MSKLTPNFEFVQPELSDASDITATNLNWTKIDTRLDKLVPKEKGSNVTSEDCANKLLNSLSTGTTQPKDDDYFISQFAGGGSDVTTYHRRPVSALWNYIKGKSEGVFSLKDHNHDGVYFKADTVRDAKTVLAAPTNSNGAASFRKLTPEDVGALSVNGGIVGDLTVSAPNLKPLKAVNSTAVPCYTHYSGKDGALGFLGFNEKDAPAFLNSAGNQVYKLYHTGNKPTPGDIGAASKSNVNTVTLTYSNWTSDGTFTIINTYATSNSIVEIAPSSSITATQLKALQKANIIDGGITTGKIVLKAMGDIPTVNIPIVIIVRGDA